MNMSMGVFIATHCQGEVGAGIENTAPPSALPDPPVIGTAMQYTPGTWSSGTPEFARWESSADGSVWATAAAMPDADSPPTDAEFGLLLRVVETNGGVTAESAAVGPVSFDPLTIADIETLLDASDAATLFQDAAGTTPATADADPVGHWANLNTAASDATQETPANAMIRKLSIQNGLSVLRAVSGDRYGITLSSSQDMTLYAVVKPSSLSSVFYIMGKMGGSGNRGWIANIATDGSVAFPSYKANTIQNLASAAGAVSAGTTVLLTFMRKSGDRRIYIGSTLIASDTLAGPFDVTTAVGGIGSGFPTDTPSVFAVGDFMQIIWIPRFVTNDELTLHRAYLTARWGL